MRARKEGAKVRKKSKTCVILRILDDEKILWAGEFPGCLDAFLGKQIEHESKTNSCRMLREATTRALSATNPLTAVGSRHQGASSRNVSGQRTKAKHRRCAIR